MPEEQDNLRPGYPQLDDLKWQGHLGLKLDPREEAMDDIFLFDRDQSLRGSADDDRFVSDFSVNCPARLLATEATHFMRSFKEKLHSALGQRRTARAERHIHLSADGPIEDREKAGKLELMWEEAERRVSDLGSMPWISGTPHPDRTIAGKFHT